MDNRMVSREKRKKARCIVSKLSDYALMTLLVCWKVLCG